jgi:NMD protein affecting ribosome stability and mRNA decay
MAAGHWECLYCESASKPRKQKGKEVCRNCGAPWEEAIWVSDEYNREDEQDRYN